MYLYYWWDKTSSLKPTLPLNLGTKCFGHSSRGRKTNQPPMQVITTLNRASPDDKVIEKLRSLEMLSQINYIILKLAHTFSQVYFGILFELGEVVRLGHVRNKLGPTRLHFENHFAWNAYQIFMDLMFMWSFYCIRVHLVP